MTMKQMLGSLGVGLVGALLALGGWHLYQDHYNFHALVNMMIAQQQSQPHSGVTVTPEGKK